MNQNTFNPLEIQDLTELQKEIRNAINQRKFDLLSLNTKELLTEIAYNIVIKKKYVREYKIPPYLLVLKSCSTDEILKVNYILSRLDAQKEEDFKKLFLVYPVLYIESINIMDEFKNNIQDIVLPPVIKPDSTFEEKINEYENFFKNLPIEIYQEITITINEFADLLNATRVFYKELVNFYTQTQNIYQG
jgi:hypothetical protein